MYIKELEIRWSDIDANRHVANSAYVNLLSQTRMSFLESHGITQRYFAEHNFGPVVFNEEYHYIKEVHAGSIIKASLELLANNKDYSQIKFAHCIFNHKNELCVYSEAFFGWMDLKARKLIAPPQKLLDLIDHTSHADNHYELPEGIHLKNEKVPYGKKLV
jgi:acyl-CoA thioester hydrolase